MKTLSIETIKTVAIVGLAASTAYFAYRPAEKPAGVVARHSRPKPVKGRDTIIIPPAVVPAASGVTPAVIPPVVYMDKRQAQEMTAEIQRRAGAVTEPFLRIIDSLQRVVVLQQKSKPDASADLAIIKLQRDTINNQRRQLAIAKNIPSLFRDRNVTVPVFLPALEGDTTHPLIDLAALRYNAELSLKDSTYQRNPFYEKQYYTVLKTDDLARATFSGKSSYILKREQPKLGFRIQALTTYSIWRQSFSVGIGTRVDYGNRFNAGFNAIINPFTGIPEISIYAKEDIAQWGR